jgi:pimeloyl-ACP methyl ester carboxylesterase
MTIERARNVGPARIDIAYERLGDAEVPPVLLIMGLAAQLIGWPDGFCQELVRRGLQVIRFDNRDAGESTHMTSAPPPDLTAALAGDLSSASYTLSDMAADTVGLLDALGLDSAHLVGASMGGCIAQMVAIAHPRRVRSLTSMMATTGDRAVGQPHVEAMRALGGPPVTTRAEVVQRTLDTFRVLGSPGFTPDLDAVAERAGCAFDRGFDPVGIARQAVAEVASSDRTERLRALDVPALVIHGAADPMRDVSGGRDPGRRAARHRRDGPQPAPRAVARVRDADRRRRRPRRGAPGKRRLAYPSTEEPRPMAAGVSLADWLNRHGPMPLEQFVPLFERICEVVHAGC